jgi:hypothetical protein
VLFQRQTSKEQALATPAALEMNVSIHISNFFKNKLRGTWLHHLFAKLRSIKQHLTRRSDGERFLLQQYFNKTGEHLNVSNPETFSEKLYCRMISLNREKRPRFTQLADKHAVRTYVTAKVGDQYLVKLLWHGKDPHTIPFDALPSEYVIKPNHGSGQVIVVKGRADRADIIQKASVWLKTNYYWGGRENQYFHIEPRMMIEEYLIGEGGSEPLDFRFWCFNGSPEVIQVDNHAHNINPFFDTQWNLLDLHYREGAARPAIAKPANLEEMIFVASNLSADFGFVRVDLYNVDGRICFGELTFTPAGSLKLQPKSWDMKLGTKWKMPADYML